MLSPSWSPTRPRLRCLRTGMVYCSRLWCRQAKKAKYSSPSLGSGSQENKSRLISLAEAPPPSSPVKRSRQPSNRPPKRRASARAGFFPVGPPCSSRAGYDWNTAEGTGPGGTIQKKDGWQPQPGFGGSPPTPGLAITADQVIPFTRIRQRIAERLYVEQTDDCPFPPLSGGGHDRAQQWRQTFNQAENTHVTVTDLIIFTAAKALAEFRRLNAHVQADRMLIRQDVNVGVATALEDGLLTPVIAAADQKSLLEISRISKQNAEAARRGMADSSVSSTFTISSLGQFGIPISSPLSIRPNAPYWPWGPSNPVSCRFPAASVCVR